jgi:cation:H+ antiporter
VALATSMPEIVITLAAIRLGAVDLVLGALLGSNLFNLAILALNDPAYRPGPLLEASAPVHLVSVISALVMTGAVLIGLTYRPRQRVLHTVGWISIGLFLAYLINTSICFSHV